MNTSNKKITLENGLTIQIKEIHTAPLISHWVWYRVGSRNEHPGITGISHWVEHMQFKGTDRFPTGALDKAISRDGGYWNAYTHLDWTTYFETLPSDKIDLALELEADRMVNSAFKVQEVESERTVIISEKEGNENEPANRLNEAVQNAAFDKHPYRNEVIGNLEDLQNMQREDLFSHYQTYYSPANAVVTIAGDFDTEKIIEKIHQYYDPVPSKNELPTQKIIPETAFNSQRDVEVKGPGETTYLNLAYRSPAGKHKDFFAFTILDSLLTGPSGLNMFGGGISNKTSRLYRSLVENEKAINVHGGIQATVDPFIYEIFITVHPEKTHLDVLSVLDDEIKRLQDQLVTHEEILRAIKQARALFAYGSENITNQAFWMGFSEMFATYKWFENYVAELEKVTPEDVQRIAQVYLDHNKRVVGAYIPTMESEA